jgi:hypothetical protein
MKLYSAKIYEGYTPVRHYIPMRRKSNGACGLYEVYTKTFLENAGTGNVTAGAVLTNQCASIYDTNNISGTELIEI